MSAMPTQTPGPSPFEKELQGLINRHSKENASNTPDFLLADYLNGCLGNFSRIVQAREKWYGRLPEPARASEEPGCKTCRQFAGRTWKNSEFLDIVCGCIEGKTVSEIAKILYRPVSEVEFKIQEFDRAIARLNNNPTP